MGGGMQHATQVLNVARIQVCEPHGRFQEFGGLWCKFVKTPAIIRLIRPKKDRFWDLLYQINSSK